LFFEDGKRPANLGFFDNGVKEDASPDLSEYHCRSGHFNDCIMRKAVEQVRPLPYCKLYKAGPGQKYNCQDWTDAVRRKYVELANDPAVGKECCK
jgi:hypothetical protein